MKPTESTRTHDPGHENSTETKLSITREELEQRKHQHSTTDRYEQPQCPECGSVKVIRKTDRHKKQRKHPADHRCGNCSSHFDEPVDPDELQAVTDGGQPISEAGRVVICTTCRTPVHPDRAVQQCGEPVHRDCDRPGGCP